MLPTDLIRFNALAIEGREARLASGLRSGALTRVRHGFYADSAAWSEAPPEERMRLLAHSLSQAEPRVVPVFAFVTAAALHRLPLFRADAQAVHTIDSGRRRARTRAGVVRHNGPLPSNDVTEVDGLLVTTASRTVFDVIRTETVESAVACMDAALRAVAWRGWGRYDITAAEAFRSSLVSRIDAAPGMRGIRQARFVAAFADGRAQLPGESVSRLWMRRLGVERPELQREVPLSSGRRAYPDFAWPRLRKFGEFDGDGKYVDPALNGGRSVREVMRAQRAREGELIAATGWTPVRWGMERLIDEAAFASFLRAQHLLS